LNVYDNQPVPKTPAWFFYAWLGNIFDASIATLSSGFFFYVIKFNPAYRSTISSGRRYL